MGRILRGLGLLVILAGVVLLLVQENVDIKIPVAPASLLVAGALAFLVGVVLGIVSRASAAVIRRHCARCPRPVQPGEIYCTEHFRESIDRFRDAQNP